MDESVTSKTIQTLWLFQAFLIPGINNSVLGPTIIDLQYFLHEPGLKRLSFLFILSGCGTIIGSALSSVLPKKHLRLRLGAAVLMTSAVLMLTPLVPVLPYFTFMFLIHSTLKGLVICYSVELCGVLWTRKGVAMQFVLAGTTLGGMLTPLVAEPFLSMSEYAGDALCLNPKFALTSMCKNEGESSSKSDNNWTQITFTLFNYSGGHYHTNETERTPLATNHILQKVFNIDSEAQTPMNLSDMKHPSEVVTQVRWAFVVLGALTLPCGWAILYYWFKNLYDVVESPQTEYEELGEPPTAITGRLETSMLGLVVMFAFPLAGLSVLYCGLLTVFGVAGPLALSKSVMTKMTSGFFACSLTGKLANSALSSVLEIDKVIALNLLLLVPTSISLAFVAPNNLTVLWICNICFGLYTSPYSGAVFAYTDKYVTLSPRVIAMITLSSGIGNMVLPYLGSVLLELYWPVGHMYLSLSLVVFMSSIFTTMLVIALFIDRRKR